MSGACKILVIGKLDRFEFGPIRDWLQKVRSDISIQFSDRLPSRNVTTAERGEAPATDPDFVIVCQSWSDEFPASDVTRCLGQWPLAIWVCCYGVWCASDGRTRTIWPISTRVPVDEACHRLNHVWRVLTEQSEDPLPLTASRDEAFAFDHCE